MSSFLTQSFFTQTFWIPKPTLTERNLSDQTGRLYLITGGYTGVGEELARILYSKNATVYVAGRNPEKALLSIERLKAKEQSSTGRLEFLRLDLSDLSGIKAAVEEFQCRETRLDVLVNNAGVMFPPRGSRSTQEHDLQFGTNCLGPYLLTRLLKPVLLSTAASSPAGSVRVLWASSSAIQVLAPQGGIVEDESRTAPQVLDDIQANYGQTKVGNVYLASSLQAELGPHGIISVSFNPGNLKTELYRHSSGVMARLFQNMLHPPVYGAYTELFAACSPDVGASSLYVMPWGRIGPQYVRGDVLRALEDGRTDRFIKWCENEVSSYI